MEKKIQRVLDANFNRAKEGLRVCEDVCRFVYEDRRGAAALKALRHQITEAAGVFERAGVILCRDVAGDVGQASIGSELRRKTVDDILFANFQRAKESVRVLEEFAKLSSVKASGRFKMIRYSLYRAEQSVTRRLRGD